MTVVLMAVDVDGSVADAVSEVQMALGERFAHRSDVSWWHPDDERTDGSDLDSAVFCLPGGQEQASRLLFAAGLTGKQNVVACSHPVWAKPTNVAGGLLLGFEDVGEDFEMGLIARLESALTYVRQFGKTLE